jgi:hypothetical protein
MKRHLLCATLAVALCVTLSGVAAAQVRVHLGLGVLAGTDLTHDSLATAVALRPDPGLAVALGIDTPLNETYRLGIEVQAEHGTLALHGTSTVGVTTLTVWRPALRLSRDISRRIGVHAVLGALIYAPAQRTGTLFQDGMTPEPVVGAGMTLQHQLGSRLMLGLALDYDVHRFTTNALTSQGFSGASTVQRVALTLRLTRLGRASP